MRAADVVLAVAEQPKHVHGTTASLSTCSVSPLLPAVAISREAVVRPAVGAPLRQRVGTVVPARRMRCSTSRARSRVDVAPGVVARDRLAPRVGDPFIIPFRAVGRIGCAAGGGGGVRSGDRQGTTRRLHPPRAGNKRPRVRRRRHLPRCVPGSCSTELKLHNVSLTIGPCTCTRPG